MVLRAVLAVIQTKLEARSSVIVRGRGELRPGKPNQDPLNGNGVGGNQTNHPSPEAVGRIEALRQFREHRPKNICRNETRKGAEPAKLSVSHCFPGYRDGSP